MVQAMRTCVGCRRRAPRTALVRYVWDGSQVVLDSRAVLPGRGVWLHDDDACRASAQRRRALHRGLRISVQ